MSSRSAKKNQEIVRKMGIKPANKVCFDCHTKNTPNVVLDFGIFVCTFCSGIHRHFQHKVKGISMTNFNDDQVQSLKKNGGNEGAKNVWLATWDKNELPTPKPYDEKGIKRFIHTVFEKKRYYDDSGKKHSPPVESIHNIIKDPVKLEVQKRAEKAGKQGKLFDYTNDNDATFDAKFDDDFESQPVTQSSQKKPAQQKAQSNDLDSFFTSDAPSNNGFGNDFGSDFNSLNNSKLTGSALADELFKNVDFQQQPPPMNNQGYGNNFHNNNNPQQFGHNDPFGNNSMGNNQMGYNNAPYGNQQQQQQPFGGNSDPFGNYSGNNSYNMNHQQNQPQQHYGMNNQRQQNSFDNDPFGNNSMNNNQPFRNNPMPNNNQQQHVNDPFGNGPMSQQNNDAFGDPFGNSSMNQHNNSNSFGSQPPKQPEKPKNDNLFSDLGIFGSSSTSNNTAPTANNDAFGDDPFF